METLNEILPASAARHRDLPAFIIKPAFRTKVWTYGDLADLVPRVATVLCEAGIGRGDRVILWGPNRPEWCIAFLAALHAGAIPVPLNVRDLPEFAQRVAQRTRAVAAVVSTFTRVGAGAMALPILIMEELPDRARDAQPLPRAELRPEDLAEIVFTSGTTGDPKGAMLTHRNILSNALSAKGVFPVGPKTRHVSVAPLSHMMEQLAGLLVVLLAGASVVYPTSRQPSAVARTFREFKGTITLVSPQIVRNILAAIERRAQAAGRQGLFERLQRIGPRLPMGLRPLLFFTVHRAFGGRLRYIVTGSAPLEPAVGERFQNMGIQVLEGYGMTECSPAVTFNRPGQQKLGSVGTPLPGIEVRVADDGEVLVRGPNVFAGYWENEEATRAVLRDGWYHTGDIGEMDADGYLSIRGRKKDMIVLADGQKVHPDDVESVLARDPRVKDSAVVGLRPSGQDVQVHAALLLHDPNAAAAVVREANTQLADREQIRGSTVWPDEDFPRTHLLKVKRGAVLDRLQQMAAGSRPAPAAEGTAPAAGGQIESLIARVSSVPAGTIRPDSRLGSDLGLDSLTRVELLGVIEEELGAYIDDAALDPETTVAQLSELVERTKGTKPEADTYSWPLHPLVRSVGLIAQHLLVWPFIRIFYKVKVTGEEKLARLRGPVLFTPNHHLHYDNGIILLSIPLRWRWQLAVAAAADSVYANPLNGIFSSILANAFPIAREGAIRRSLERLGARLDRKFSVLIYPEGKLTVGGPIQPFKSGTGLIAVEGGTPVVPMKLKINRMSSVLDRLGSTPRGDVEVVFGDPLYFSATTDPTEATQRIQTAVAAL
jgi:long-chain acyl-CoA synthetase